MSSDQHSLSPSTAASNGLNQAEFTKDYLEQQTIENLMTILKKYKISKPKKTNLDTKDEMVGLIHKWYLKNTTTPTTKPTNKDKELPYQPIDITKYTSPFDKYPDELVQFAKDNSNILPNIISIRGQALALLSQPENRGQKYADREIATQFFKNIGKTTDDSIQAFNKDFGGIQKIQIKGKYCLQYPFTSDKTDVIKRAGAKLSGDKTEAISLIKGLAKKNIIDVPDDNWQLGHLDPTIPNAGEDNLAWQPPIQGKYRDRFKFCPFFQKMWPTGNELISKWDEYYTEDEQKKIFDNLSAKFAKIDVSPTTNIN